MPARALDQQVYQTGSLWSVHDILAHFVSAEESFGILIENIAAGGDGAPRSLDIDEFNEDEVPGLAVNSSDYLLARFEQARLHTVASVEVLENGDLERVGYHPWFGEVELRKMLKLIYRHNMIHLRDIRRALQQKAPVPHLDINPRSAN